MDKREWMAWAAMLVGMAGTIGTVIVVLCVIIKMRWNNRKVRARCGHMTTLVGTLHGHGDEKIIQIESGVEPQYCWECQEKMTIYCTCCRMPIFVDDPIALYGAWKGGAATAWTKWWYDEEGFRYSIGCLRPGCALGNVCSGYWIAPGLVILRADPHACPK